MLYPICSVVAVFKMLTGILNTLRSRIWDITWFLFFCVLAPHGMNEIVFGERRGRGQKVVAYYTLEKYSVPMSSKGAKGANYQDVMEKFEEAGFENITLEVEYDIITGWITDDGEVKSVTVNDDGKFASGKEYRADAEVVITYHTYRSNKPK